MKKYSRLSSAAVVICAGGSKADSELALLTDFE